MAHIEFDIESCKGCLLCTEVCPKKIIEQGQHMNRQGYKVAFVSDAKMSECTGCASCAVMCPDVAITVYR